MRRIFIGLALVLLTSAIGVGVFLFLSNSKPSVPLAPIDPSATIPEPRADAAPFAKGSSTLVVSVPTPAISPAPVVAQKSTTTPTVHESTPGPLVQAPKTVATSTAVITPVLQPPAPPPTPTVGSDVPSQVGALSQSGILKYSNDERIKAGFPPLAFSKRLSSMAEGKVIDMIAKQYFAHESPDGTTIGMLAKKYGYTYLFVGENLALGDFDSSLDVVTGWMNSPGHRANILSKDFTEIGISALRGNYEGHEVWYAVQEFGKPMPVCASPDAGAKERIAVYEDQLPVIEESIRVIEAELKVTSDREAYNAKVKEYQALVELYNSTIRALKADIAIYNVSVESYNLCING